MPKDNNQQPTTNNNPVSITDDMPPVMIEDTLPPMAMDNQPPPITSPQSPSSDSGSAAPSNDVVMPLVVTSGPNTGKPAKKFGSGKIIATILGLFLLIGGIGAGTYLVQQNQDIREKAGGCRDDSDCDNGQTCNKFDRCEGGGGGGGGIYTCGEGSGDGCEGKSNGDSCGGEKVCKIRENGTECSCVGESQPTAVPTVAPTVPPTAQCQNIKAYSTNNWTLLTPAVLSTLKTGDSVNFCVTGSASSGSFDKAKFTINGAVQAETTTIRPSSTDFCQSYVIPVGVTTFNVTAQIHHLTLGWK